MNKITEILRTLIVLVFFNTNCLSMPALKTKAQGKPFSENKSQEEIKLVKKKKKTKKWPQKKISLFKKKPKVKTGKQQSKIKKFQLPFDKWIKFVKQNWSDSENYSNEHIKAVENKCKKVQMILDRFVETNLEALEQNENWEEQKTPEKLKILLSLKTLVEKDPVNQNEITFHGYFEESSSKFAFPSLPLAQKLIVPQNSRIFVFGDFHGNFNALINLIQNFIDQGVLNNSLKLQNNNYFIFLGDYTGRGQQATEILLTLFRLKIQNPERVLLIRGNHESFQQNIQDRFLKNKIYDSGELENKMLHLRFSPKEKIKQNYLRIINSILYSYEFMPATLFLGYESKELRTQFIELSHGSIDHRYNPQHFLDSKLTENKSIQFSEIKLNNFMDLEIILKKYWPPGETTLLAKQFAQTPKNIIESFLWSDIHKNINISPNTTPFIMENENRGTGLIYTVPFIKQYFDQISSEKSKVVMLIRGHEHAMPYELRNGDNIGAVQLDNTITTVISGIYSTPNLGVNWGYLQYFPTFLELTPPTENKNLWNIKIRYLENKKEKAAATKIQALWRGYKSRKDRERSKIDVKLEDLKINKDTKLTDLQIITKNIKHLDINKESRRELSDLIKDNDVFTGNNKEFANFILNLKYKANYKTYLDKQIIVLIEKRVNEMEYASDEETESITESASDYDDENENDDENFYVQPKKSYNEDFQKRIQERLKAWGKQSF